MVKIMIHRARYKKPKIRVVCMECGKKFLTTKIIPQCPKCNSVDIEPVFNYVPILRKVDKIV